MNNYWVSWWHRESMGNFDLKFPWWETGMTQINGDVYISICAHIKVDDGDDLLSVIRESYIEKPRHLILDCRIHWRFVVPKPEGWEPQKDRFPKDKNEVSDDQ